MNKLEFQNSSENQKVKNVERSCERYIFDRSLEDILPSPVKFRLWNKSESALRPLCKAQGSLRNILNSCPRELAEGRYRWRQDILPSPAKFRVWNKCGGMLQMATGSYFKSYYEYTLYCHPCKSI